MILTLEISGPQGAQLGSLRRFVFRDSGGTLGRDGGNTWVLPDGKVSGRHAQITYKNGTFYIEDTSRNGVCINSPKNRLERGRPYALQPDDRIFIDPYEIQVSIDDELADVTQRFPSKNLPPQPMRSAGAQPFTPDDPFASHDVSPLLSDITPSSDASPDQVLDPLRLIPGGSAKRAPERSGPSLQELQHGSPWEAHYQPPSISPAPGSKSERQVESQIPQGYNPLAPEDSGIGFTPPPVPIATEPVIPIAPLEPMTPLPPFGPRPSPAERLSVDPAVQPRATPPPVRPSDPAIERRPAASADDFTGTFLADLLGGAGLEGAAVTPELAQNFGQILRIVVSGVMDILQARHEIKEEFRLHVTHFRPADNNPLKFSANVDDALHNLLVKRNAAYLSPVEAFADAFDDLRNHQIAMLAGMRVAFEAMLADFEPEKLQEQFDRQLDKGSLLSVPAKLRYWDLYRDLCRDLLKDPEASFRKLFGEEFAEAYEKQLQRLKRDRGASRQP